MWEVGWRVVRCGRLDGGWLGVGGLMEGGWVWEV